jgi:hypothetical protein
MDIAVFGNDLTRIFHDLLSEVGIVESTHSVSPIVTVSDQHDRAQEAALIKEFFAKPCRCGKDCQLMLREDEVLQARSAFQQMTWSEKNAWIISQLKSFQNDDSLAKSGRVINIRTRQKFLYRVSADRAVCQQVFLFFYGETHKRLESLQKHLRTMGTMAKMHGNKGRTPKHAIPVEDQNSVEAFIINYGIVHGLPDPGRDMRHGKDRVRILLPAVMNWKSVHQVYRQSTLAQSLRAVSYDVFLRIWQERVSFISFAKPRTDLCMDCENFKKRLNQVAADLDEKREGEKIAIHQEATMHLDYVKKERDYYRKCIKDAESAYNGLSSKARKCRVKPNSRNIVMHYSWDFAQQLHYPYEDQQVGPIYFKTPRRAQLFGVCCEAVPNQVNYLIDEADFTDKNANTVITLLDHYFSTYGFGEKHATLSADNCIGQNKNNALLHYLMYRVLIGLHERIDFSFLIAGHTKFAPDGYFGLIKYHYRRSKVYTYEHLTKIIQDSSRNGHNICQPYRDFGKKHPAFLYRNWSFWFEKFFNKLPQITKYHHFSFSSKKPGIVTVKESIDSQEEQFNLLKKTFPYSSKKLPARLPAIIVPEGISDERAWYLYDTIRDHIPTESEKNLTCPMPNKLKTQVRRNAYNV